MLTSSTGPSCRRCEGDVDAAEFWSIGDYATVGELWGAPGRDLAAAVEPDGLDIVDLATGTGVTALAMAERGARSVVGVDVTSPLLEEAARRAARLGLSIDWVEADMTAVPLPDRSADLVVSTFGLIFAPDPVAAIDECRRLTRPGGRIIFTSWARTGLFGRLRTALAPYFPHAPEPWHERAEDIRSVVGQDARVTERSFTMSIASPESFVSQLEQQSAPFVLGAQALGDRWTDARSALVDVVAGAAEQFDGAYGAEVGYLVTTITVAEQRSETTGLRVL